MSTTVDTVQGPQECAPKLKRGETSPDYISSCGGRKKPQYDRTAAGKVRQ